jgi:hypothetical protein
MNTGATFGGCAPGYVVVDAAAPIDTDGVCTACTVTNCRACSTAAAATCLTGQGSCATGFQYNATSTSCVANTATNCLIPDPYDLTSTYNQVTTLCAVCNPGWVLNPLTKTCISCPANCNNGTVSSTDGSQPNCYVGWLATGVSSGIAYCRACNQNYTLVQTDTTSVLS